MSTSHEVLRRLAAASEELHPLLTRYDQVTGDGDFGDNFRDALVMVRERLADRTADDGFRVAADVFLDEVGGSSGPLLGLLFNAIARRTEETDDLPAALAAGVPEGTAAVQRVGEAEPGDRTMVDALVPAGESLGAGASITETALRVRDAALATAGLRARRGRSSYVGEHAVGTPDPGAVGVAVLFWALATVMSPGTVPDSVEEFIVPDSVPA